MSKINKSRNLFLEKEELVRQDRFTQDDGLESFIKSITKNGGIVSDNEGSLGNNFLPVFTDYGYVAFSEDSIAYNTQGERIYFKYQSFYQYKLPTWTDDSSTYWMYIQKGITSIEEGTIVMGTNGAITGSGTSFTELFRGQTSLVPNKIRVYSKTESSTGGSGYTYSAVGTYEVNEVESNTVMYVNAFDALSGTAYVYSVVGAFSPGTYDDSREEEIYEYDFVDVVFSETDPTDTLTDDQYLLAKIKIDTDFETNTYITDLRTSAFAINANPPNYDVNTERYSFENFDYIRNTNEGTLTYELAQSYLSAPVLLSERSNYTNVIIIEQSLPCTIRGIAFNDGEGGYKVNSGEEIKLYNNSDYNLTLSYEAAFTKYNFNILSDIIVYANQWVILMFGPIESATAKWTVIAPQTI